MANAKRVMTTDDVVPNDDTPDRLAALEAQVQELAHDLAALAELAAQVLGQPFARQAAEIIAKRQTGPALDPEALAKARTDARKAGLTSRR